MRRYIIQLIAACLLIVIAMPARAEVPVWHMLKDKSSLKFFAIQNGAPVAGAFSDFDADITFDPEQAEKSSVVVTVNTGSVTSNNADVAKNLALPEWFSTAAFPKATFKASKMTRMPMSNNFYARGELTLRGITKPATLNFMLDHIDEHRAVATGSVTIPRLDFGVGQGEWKKDDVVKNEVRVEFRIVAEKK